MTKTSGGRVLAAGIAFLLIAVPWGGRAHALQDTSYGASDWQRFGAAEMEKAPPHIKDAKTPVLEKVQYITKKVEEELVRRRYTANTSTVGRFVSWVKTGDLETGTCGDLTGVLGNALEGVKVDVLDANGLPKKDQTGKAVQAPLLEANQLQTVAGAKATYLEKDDLEAKGDDGSPKYMTENQDRWPRSRQDLVNNEHGALVVMVTGKPYVFDLWMFGAEGDESLKGFSGSKWNGLPLTEWGKAMMFKGYKQFQILNEQAPAPWSSLEKTLVGLTALTARKATVPRTAESDRAPDEALGNAIKKVDGERKVTTVPPLPVAPAADRACAAKCREGYDKDVASSLTIKSRKGYWHGMTDTNCWSRQTVPSGQPDPCWSLIVKCPTCKDEFQSCCHESSVINAQWALDRCLKQCVK